MRAITYKTQTIHTFLRFHSWLSWYFTFHIHSCLARISRIAPRSCISCVCFVVCSYSFISLAPETLFFLCLPSSSSSTLPNNIPFNFTFSRARSLTLISLQHHRIISLVLDDNDEQQRRCCVTWASRFSLSHRSMFWLTTPRERVATWRRMRRVSEWRNKEVNRQRRREPRLCVNIERVFYTFFLFYFVEQNEEFVAVERWATTLSKRENIWRINSIQMIRMLRCPECHTTTKTTTDCCGGEGRKEFCCSMNLMMR